MKKFTILLMFFLPACAQMPTQQEINLADYGEYPSNSTEIVKTFYSKSLKDPDSAVYKYISPPIKTVLGDRFQGVKYGYLVCATVNAKNSYGGYVGYHTDGFFIQNNIILNHLENGVWWGKNMC
ncbi:hypothetical protein [uncultured Tolumonas sp.]|uniref:hypothetical protein n=1 Tax=uncultured Tolumonas sp. TaxID=263765 RepID=UPI002931832C|nr:hypothetical protein [uncultured Tolumonas sp.]